VDHRARGDPGQNDRFDRDLLNIGQHFDRDLAAALDDTEYGRFFLLQRSASARSLQPVAPPCALFFSTAAGFPLWPALT
jgi:hypothetical protein